MHGRITCYGCKFLNSLNKEENGVKSGKNVNLVETRIFGVPKINPLTQIQHLDGYSRSEEFTMNLDGTYDHESNTVPISLLRRFFRQRPLTSNHVFIRNYQYWERILCKIEFTIESIKNGIIDAKDFLKWSYEYQKKKYMFGFSKSNFNKIYESNKNEYSIVKAVLCRISFGYSLIDYFRLSKKPSLEFSSQLFIDTHLHLLSFLLSNNVINDRLIVDDDANNNDFQSIFTRYYPHDNRFIHSGDLPDLGPCIDLGNICFDVRPRLKNLVSAIIHIIACKTLNHKCSERNFSGILLKYFELYPIFRDLFIKMIEVSLLGNYPHAKCRLDFIRRVELINTLYHTNMTRDIKLLNRWMVENELLIEFVTKEYHMYMVTLHYPLDMAMEGKKNWAHIKVICRDTTDMIRSFLSYLKITSFNTNEQEKKYTYEEKMRLITMNAFKIMESKMAFIEQRTAVLLDKLKKCNFLDFILSKIVKDFESKIIDKNSTKRITNENFLDKDALDAIDLVAFYVAITQRRFIPTCFLKCFGISELGYNLFRDYYFGYEFVKVADNSVFKLLSRIYNNNPKDFHIIRIYFETIKKWESVKIFNFSLGNCMTTLQSIKAKHMIEPWEDLEKVYVKYHYCLVCKKWAVPIVDILIPKTAKNIYNLGSEKIARDPFTGECYCGKHANSIAIKHLMESGHYFFEGTISDQQTAKLIRRHKSAISCSSVPLTYVFLPGHIISINGKTWACCVICGQPTIFEGAKFGPNGFTCCYHKLNGLKKDEMSHDKKNVDILINGKDDPLLKKRIDVNSNVNNLGYCIYCAKECDFDENRLFWVVEDQEMDKLNEIIPAMLCESDYEKAFHMLASSIIIIKSDLFAYLTNSRTRVIAKYEEEKKKARRKNK